MLGSQCNDGVFDARRKYPTIPFLWSGAFWIQSLKLPFRGRKIRLPTEEGAFGNGEGFGSCLGTVLLPEREDTASILGLCGNHIPEAYQTLPGEEKPFCSSEFVELVHTPENFSGVPYVSELMHGSMV